MDFLLRTVEGIVEWTGRLVAWLTLAVVLTVFLVVVLRYTFGLGWAWLQELYVYMHAVAFMLGAAFTLKHGRHVRVDIVYGRARARYRGLVDLLGSLVLILPVFGWVVYASWPFVAISWARLEASHQSGGLPTVFLLKTVIPVACALLMAQGLCMAYRALRRLRGDVDESASV